MAYEKPIELKVSTQNISGTEARSVEALAKIERLLNKTLAAGDIFKSPAASIDYKTHEVSKSFFVRKEAEKLVRDTLKAHEEQFLNPLNIKSKEATTRRYKVDVEGERALASLRANTASLGGRVYGNQHGSYVEIPSYKGSLASARNDAVKITQTTRAKQEEAREKEEQKAQKEREREEIRKQKEAEKEEKQKEREKEKEDRQKEASRKSNSIAILAGLSSSVILLKKLISLVENIVTSVIAQSEKAFDTSLTAQRLNISPDLLRKLEYAGIVKGIGTAPINAMLSLQDSFGSTLLAAKNIKNLDDIMPIIGADVSDLILNGSVGTNPLGMKTMLMNRFLQALKNRSDGLGGTVSSEASAASLTSLARSALGDDFATEFARAAKDGATDYTAWLTDAIPVSTPSYNLITASGENYEEYTAALTEFKAAMDNLKLQLSPVLDKLTIALEALTGWIMRLTGNKPGVAQLSEKNYKQAQEAYERDSAEHKKLYWLRYDYAVRNEEKFGEVENVYFALTEFLAKGIVPKQLENDEAGLEEFFAMALATSLDRQLDESLRKSGGAVKEYEGNKSAYLSGEKTLTFADTEISQTVAKAEIAYEAAAHKYYSSKLKDEALGLPLDDINAALTPAEVKQFLANKQISAEQQALIDEWEKKGVIEGIFTRKWSTIKAAEKKRDDAEKENKPYVDKLRDYYAYRSRFSEGDSGEDSSTYIGSDKAKELMEAGIREFVIQTTFGGQLEAGYTYKTYTEPNQTGTLTIQILDPDGKKHGEAVTVPAYIAAPFKEAMQYSQQGED